jgi:hypothetical protein
LHCSLNPESVEEGVNTLHPQKTQSLKTIPFSPLSLPCADQSIYGYDDDGSQEKINRFDIIIRIEISENIFYSVTGCSNIFLKDDRYEQILE